jgi:hypothetical protein
MPKEAPTPATALTLVEFESERADLLSSGETMCCVGVCLH